MCFQYKLGNAVVVSLNHMKYEVKQSLCLPEMIGSTIAMNSAIVVS